ncbi:Prolipoprotein diacylglyceryl transferase [hydrothermal vent metagenome]|uniref:Prolipoprotein diacylglyceryl transferase n=1 Tax=hydrothermal vent metagenome TaxID=652676 RepID=A0A3B1AK33_9ZZZZ
MPSTDVYIIQFDPVAFEIFGFPIHWYGITYLAAFSLGWMVTRYLARTHTSWKVKPEQVDDLLFYMGLGVILGGRIGYLLFYDMGNIINEPTFFDSFIRLISIHKGGMSFHGGFLGAMLAIWFYNRKYKHGYFVIVDMMAIIAPIGLLAGRVGNVINGELWGKPTDVAWAMIFPKANLNPAIEMDLPRHPTPIYEAALEGVVLFVIIWIFARKDRPTMAISGVFALGYGLARSFVEFYRLPDAHIGYLLNTGWLTMGMLLSAPLIMVGIALLLHSYNRTIVQKA